MAFIYKERNILSVGFLGFARSNRTVYDYLSLHFPELEFTVRVREAEEAGNTNAAVYSGKRQLEAIREDLIFVSPGIRRDIKELSGRLISSDAELFFEKNANTVFGVSGSDGKSTTATLAKELLSDSFTEAHAIGNIGKPFSLYIDSKPGTAFAAELSSFQLNYFTPRLKRAVITNITPNHLDWHKNFEEYESAKENLIKQADERVFSLDSSGLRGFIKKYGAYALFSTELSAEEIIKFGAEINVYLKDGVIYLNGKEKISLKDIKRREKYNVRNLMAAMALCYGFWNDEKLFSVAGSFGGLSHRLELVATKATVEFYDSSIDSSPERTRSTLAELNGKSVVIMGGRTKMNNFDILSPALRKKALATVLIGENREEIKAAISPSVADIYEAEDMESAVKLAASLAETFGKVVLSPASTSFDRYKNFEQRGKAFSSAVLKLKDN